MIWYRWCEYVDRIWLIQRFSWGISTPFFFPYYLFVLEKSTINSPGLGEWRKNKWSKWEPDWSMTASRTYRVFVSIKYMWWWKFERMGFFALILSSCPRVLLSLTLICSLFASYSNEKSEARISEAPAEVNSSSATIDLHQVPKVTFILWQMFVLVALFNFRGLVKATWRDSDVHPFLRHSLSLVRSKHGNNQKCSSEIKIQFFMNWDSIYKANPDMAGVLIIRD